jgi:transcriptional regulator
MYLPSQFEETRTEHLHALIRDYPLGALVTLGKDGLEANHIPFELHLDGSALGTLHAHVARANPVWRNFAPDLDALVVFQGPSAYISPSWYATKRETGKVVPTYNYAVVHAYGRLRVIEERAWLRALVERLTDRFEAASAQPWKVTDAPAGYIDNLLGAIVGLELPVSRLLGKWKMSQNRPEVDFPGIVRGLRGRADASAMAVAALVDERQEK